MPVVVAGSNMGGRGRCERRWLACFILGKPFAIRRNVSRRLRRQVLRRIGLKPSPQPSQCDPPSPTSAWNFATSTVRAVPKGRSDKRGCEGRLRSSVSSKLLSACRRRQGLVFGSLAEGLTELERGSQVRLHRWRLHIYEPAHSDGTETVIDKNS